MRHTPTWAHTALCTLTILVAAVALPAQLPPSSRDVDLRVVDPKGGPIQDLRVTVYAALADGKRCRVLPGQSRVLQPKDFPEDHARLRDLPDGDLVLLVEADGYAMTLGKTFTLPAKAPVRMSVTMREGATLRGTVTTPDGTPVAGALVRTMAKEDENQHPFVQQLGTMFVVPLTRATTVTQDDGSFRIEHVAPGDYVVRAAHDDWADARRDVTVKAKGKDPQEVALRLERGGTIAGVVQRDGKRVANAVVLLQSPPEPANGTIPFQAVRIEVRTDAEGRFTLPRVPFGSYLLGAHEGGDPMAQAMQLVGNQRTVDVKPQPDGAPQQELVLLKAR